MNAKKNYFVITADDQKERLFEKAAAYFGTADWQPVTDRADLMEAIKNAVTTTGDLFNAELMLVGIAALAMSFCQCVYISKDWDSDNYCRFCQTLAFSYGLEIVYDS